MNNENAEPVVRLDFDDAMQDTYFKGIEAALSSPAPRPRIRRFANLDNTVAGKVAQASGPSVVGPSLMVFDEQLSEGDRLDAIDCQVFAEAVVRRLPKGASNELRYVTYNDALLSVGWAAEGYTYKKFVTKQVTLTMNEAVLQVLETVIAGSTGNILSMVASGFSKLKGDKGALKIVDSGSKHNQVVSFKAVPCIAGPGGGMAMVMGGLDLVDKSYDGDFLFVSFKTEGVQLFQAAGIRKFNRRMFDRKKQQVYAYNDRFGDDLFKKLTDQ